MLRPWLDLGSTIGAYQLVLKDQLTASETPTMLPLIEAAQSVAQRPTAIPEVTALATAGPTLEEHGPIAALERVLGPRKNT